MEQFFLSLSRTGGLSMWFAFLLLLANLPGLCIGLLSLIFIKDNDNLKVLCTVLELQNSSWSMDEMHNITSENLNICQYRSYNYLHLSELAFDVALEYTTTLKQKPDFVDCNDYTVFNNKQATIFSDFSLVCNSWSSILVDSLGVCLADIIAGLFIIPLGDILGRKRMISWGFIMILNGDIFILLSTSHIMLGMSWFLVSSGYRLAKFSTEIIILETANRNWRRTFYLLTQLGTPLGYILAATFYNVPSHWRQIFVFASVIVLFFPVLAWYFPESPRWLMSKNRKTKAFAILQNIKHPEMQEELLQHYKNFDRSYLSTFKDHYEQIKLTICTFTFLCVVILYTAVAMISLQSFQWKIIEQFELGKVLFSGIKYTIEVIAILFGVIPLFYLFSKKMKLLITTFLLVTGLFYITHYFLFEEKSKFAHLFLLGNVMGSISLLSASLFSLERLPTSHRATIGGIIISASTGTAKLMLIFCIKYLQVNQLSLLLGLVSLVGAGFPFVLNKLLTSDLDNDF